MKCVNKSHPTVTKLAQELGIPPVVAAARIGRFQEENNTDEFPTKEQLENTTSIKELKETIGIPKKSRSLVSNLLWQELS